MLALFRFQDRGQSWVTALGMVLDAAVLTCAIVPGAAVPEPYFMYRRGRRALNEIVRRLPPTSQAQAPLERAQFDVRLRAGTRHRPPGSSSGRAWARLQEYRSTYGPSLQALIDYLLAPPGFWWALGRRCRGRAVAWSG